MFRLESAMRENNTTVKNTRVKWSIVFLSFFIACVSTSMTIIVTLFIVTMPFIEGSQILSVLISIAGFIAAIVLAIATFKKASFYLSNYMQIREDK